ncbi:MAG: HEAT repeat domain-containing protein, partial [Cyanobacteria bacterium]|nr:HEAT repeat domain-containing protein [Cyanobacteriota bacterium]
RRYAIRALGAIGAPAANSAVDALTMCLEDSDSEVRRYAREALDKMQATPSAN